MRVLRILFYIFLLFIIICIFVVAYIVLFFNPDKLRPILIHEVKRQTGYQLAIDGKMTWSFYPQIGVKIEHMKLNAPGQAAAFMELRSVSIAAETTQFMHGREKLQGEIYIGNVRLSKLHAQNAHIGLFWQNNTLTLNPITATAYNGSLNAISHGRNMATVPQWDWDAQFNQIQLKPLMEDVLGANSKLKIAGIGQIRMQAISQGKTGDQIIKNMNGVSEFGVQQGVLEGVNLNYLVQTADALVNKQPIAPPSGNQTAFDNFTGSAVIKNGVANSNNIVLTSSTFTANAQGTIDLSAQTINFGLIVKPLQTIKTQWQVPILIKGPLSNPDIRLDISEIRQTIIQNQIENVKEKVKDEIKERLPGKPGQFLQKILGR